MTEPTWGQRRMMIYRPNPRQLDDGCQLCNTSIPACDSGNQPCCNTCDHRGNPSPAE